MKTKEVPLSDTTPTPVEIKAEAITSEAVPTTYTPRRVRPNRAQRRAEVYKRRARGLRGIF